jgi:DNA processing protein
VQSPLVLPVEHYLRLSFVEGVGTITARQLIEAFGSVAAVWQQNKQGWLSVSGVGPKMAQALAAAHTSAVTGRIEDLQEQCAKLHIQIICPDDEVWPKQWVNCSDAPLALFVYGQILCLNVGKVIGMVGARKSSEEGKVITRRWSSYLSKHGVTVVSGMAPGIDSAAHGGSLDAGKAGIAVLGYGLKAGSPYQNKQIQALAEQGCVISEYAPNMKAHPSFFPQRNRLIASLSHGLIVVEGGLKSGSLITARQALAYGKEVFAVPGSVLNDIHAGCHQLIQDGATLLTSAEQVLQDMQWQQSGKPQHMYQAKSDIEAKIITILGQEIRHVDALAEDCDLTVPALSTILLALELGGVIEKLPGSRYTLS